MSPEFLHSKLEMPRMKLPSNTKEKGHSEAENTIRECIADETHACN